MKTTTRLILFLSCLLLPLFTQGLYAVGEDDDNTCDECGKTDCDGCKCGCQKEEYCKCGTKEDCNGEKCQEGDDCKCGHQSRECPCDPKTWDCGGECGNDCPCECDCGGDLYCHFECNDCDCTCACVEGDYCDGSCTDCECLDPCGCGEFSLKCDGYCENCHCQDTSKCSGGGGSCSGSSDANADDNEDDAEGGEDMDPGNSTYEGDDGSDGEDSGYCGIDGTNPFSLDGNATRQIIDLSMTGSNPLRWIRINNSTPRGLVPAFGQGASWRHNWQYELQAQRGETGQNLFFIYPSGIRRTFVQQEDGSLGVTQAQYPEKARAVGDRFEITTQNEGVLVFEPVPASTLATPDAPVLYRALTLTSKNGRVTRFDYDDNGLLEHIINDAGNQITITYEDGGKKGGMACISRVETSDGRAVNYEYETRTGEVRTCGNACRVNAGATNDVATTKSGKPTSNSRTDSGSARVSHAASGVSPDASSNTKADMTMTAKTAKGGKPKAGVRAEQEYVILSRVHYGDGTSAEYKYDFVSKGRAPLLVEADDPRYNGRAKHIGYRYQKGTKSGVIYQEFNPATGQAYATLEFDPNDKEKRTVRYTDDRTITYRVPQGTNGRPTERVDSLGRKNTWSFGDNGAGPLEQKTVAGGKSVKYTRDQKGNITRKEQSDGLVVDIQRDKNGKVAKTSDNRGHSTEYARDSKGRVTQASKTNSGKGAANGKATAPGQIKKQAFVRDASGRLTRRDYADGTHEEFTRDNKGNILAKLDRKGGQHKFTYAERGLVASETDPADATTHYTYDPHGQRASQTDALGHTTTYERDERGLVTKQTNPDGTARLYSYDKYGRKTAETDELGRTAAWEYDSLGRLTRQTDFAGGTTRFDYTETPGGCGTCSLVSKPSRVAQPDGRIDEFLYDSEGRLLMGAAAVGTPQMATTLYAYDEANNLIQQTNPDGGVIKNTYDIDNHRLSTTDPLGRVTSWTYDTDGNMLTQTDPSGRTTDYAYDADKNLIYTVTPDGAETTYTYDAANRRTSATDALGNTTRWNYDAVGNLVSVTDAAGGKTTYTYDKVGRPTRAKLPDNTSQTLTYNAIGQVTQTLTADGLEVTNEYDTKGRVIATTASSHVGASLATPSTTRFTYDSAGRRTSTTDALNRTTTYDYNIRNQLTTTTYPDGTKTQKDYDAAGRVLADIDQLGHTTRYTYTAMGDQATLTDANGSTYAFEYDAMRRKTSMIYPDNTAEQWTYDLGGRIATYTTRADQSKTVAYNLDGKPLTETWHPANCAPDVSYTYDGNGRLASLDNGNALLTYTYDKLGRITSETTDIRSLLSNMAPHKVGYQYDALNRKAGLTYPDGMKVTYTYDAQGRMTEVYNGNHKPLATYEYDSFGRRAKLTRDNGVVTNYTYDSASQVLGIQHLDKSNKALAFAYYEYDNMGRRTAMTRENLQTDRYRYDPTGQLIGVDYSTVGASLATPGSSGMGVPPMGLRNTGDSPVPPRTESFTYDPLGNRLEHTDTTDGQPPMITQYQSNHLNQYTQITHTGNSNPVSTIDTQPTESPAEDAIADVPLTDQDETTGDGQTPQSNPTVNRKPGTVNLSYDSNGNLTDDGTQLYKYDAQNRLVEVEAEAVKAEFAYDAKNRCVLRRCYTLDSNGVFVPDEANSIAMTYDTAWNILSGRVLSSRQTAEYIHGNRADEVLAQIRDSESVYPLGDALNSTIMLVGQNGGSLGVYRYDAFGRPSGEDIGYRFLYTGREWLQSVGLSDHRNRYYNPSTGRWLSPDPIRYYGGVNLYAYVNNSIVNYYDSLGLITSFDVTDLGLRPKVKNPKYENASFAGETTWSINDYTYRARSVGDCCTILDDVDLTVNIEYWYSSDEDKSHELNHVNNIKNGFRDPFRILKLQPVKPTCMASLIELSLQVAAAEVDSDNQSSDASEYTDPIAQYDQALQALQSSIDAGNYFFELLDKLSSCACKSQ